MNGLLGTFLLEMFDEFFTTYKAKNILAPEALLALKYFLPALNEFLDLYGDLSEEIIANNTNIHWYSYTNMVTSEDYIRAISKYYNESAFSNVSVNMNAEEIEDYNTDNGICFCKVCIYLIYIDLFNLNIQYLN